MLFDRPPPDGLIEERTLEVARVESRETDDLESALLFRLGAEWLLLDAINIVEVAEPRVIRRIPRRTDSVFLGIVNIRGELRLAFDLRQMLGIAALEGSPKSLSRFVVIHWERQTWVFPADEVSAVIRHGRARETGAPSTLERWKSALVRTVVDWEGKKAGKIDPGELLARLVKHVG
jgi:chemotaxis-related protein WspD